MDRSIAQKYYLRDDIQRAILDFAQDREIAVRFSTFFGKRPDIIEYLSDVKKFVSKGVTSFHSSEERWLNPLILNDSKLSAEQKQDNRLGWDLILDLDGIDYIFSRIAGRIIIDFLNELGVHNVTTKFSGNKGFHIGIPFEAFSKNILGIGETRKLFPELPRKIATYLMVELRGRISKAILEHSGTIDKIEKKYGLRKDELRIDDEISNNFDYLKVIEIDTILITARHLFRMPYSLNEKSGLSSIPIPNEQIGIFEREWASPDKVDPTKHTEYKFLSYNSKFGRDADNLLLKAIDVDTTHMTQISEKIASNIDKEIRGEKRGIIFTGDNTAEVFEIEGQVEIKDFPKTIDFILNNIFDDGKKRALFVLITFLYSVKWQSNTIQIMISEWNLKQETPLKQNYIDAQFSWFKNQNKIISPPNFSNEEYYRNIGIPIEIIKNDRSKFRGVTIKNPLHYVFILHKRSNKKETEEVKKTEEKKSKE